MGGRLWRDGSKRGWHGRKKPEKRGFMAAFITKPERKQGIAAAEVLWRVASAQGKAREKIFLL